MPAPPRLTSQTPESIPIALDPAMISAGPSRPRSAISRPRDAVAFFPCVYRLGEKNTESMWILYQAAERRISSENFFPFSHYSFEMKSAGEELPNGFVGRSPCIARLREQIERIGASRTPVLIQG